LAGAQRLELWTCGFGEREKEVKTASKTKTKQGFALFLADQLPTKVKKHLCYSQLFGSTVLLFSQFFGDAFGDSQFAFSQKRGMHFWKTPTQAITKQANCTSAPKTPLKKLT